MFELIKAYISYGLELFHQNKELYAIFGGVLISLLGTQSLKNLLPDSWSDSLHRQVTQSMSIAITTFFVFAIWHIVAKEDPFGLDFIVSLGLGISTPVLYKVVMMLVYKKWPQLEEIMSARPKL